MKYLNQWEHLSNHTAMKKVVLEHCIFDLLMEIILIMFKQALMPQQLNVS